MSRYDNIKNAIDVSWLQELNNYGVWLPTLLVDPKDKTGTANGFKKLDKGCLLYVKDHKYPMRAHIRQDKVNTVCQMKKMIPFALRSFKGKINSLIALWYFKNNWTIYLDFLHGYLRDVYYNNPSEFNKSPDRYNQPVREIYRVLSGWDEIFDKIRDIICSVIEYDMAYRYRVQDILPLLNKEAFYRNPIKEITRLMDIMISREVDGGQMNAKWGKLKLFIWLLRFRPMLLERLKKIVKNLDLKELEPAAEDRYWMSGFPYELYNFDGKPFEQRRYEFLQMKYVS
jgi:hypothetical protein